MTPEKIESEKVVIKNEFGLTLAEEATAKSSFTPILIEKEAIAEQYNALIVKEMTIDVCNEFGALHWKLVKARTGIAAAHKVSKEYFLAGGRFCDAIKNKETALIEVMEAKCLEGKNYFAKIEEARILQLKKDREAKLSEVCENISAYPNLELMLDESFEALILEQKDLKEFRAAKAIEAENKRLEEEKALQLAETERLRVEAEEKEKERLRVEALRIENEKLLAQQIENEKIAAELKRVADEKLAKLAKDAKDEAERVAKVAADLKAKNDAIALEAKIASDKAIKDAKDEAERVAKEIEAIKLAEIAKEEAIKLAAKNALLAPDKDKFIAISQLIKEVAIPNFESEEAKKLSEILKSQIEKMCNWIESSANNL